MVVGQLSLKVLFRDIWRMICYIDLKRGTINFHKQKKQLPKYQHLGKVPLTLSWRISLSSKEKHFKKSFFYLSRMLPRSYRSKRIVKKEWFTNLLFLSKPLTKRVTKDFDFFLSDLNLDFSDFTKFLTLTFFLILARIFFKYPFILLSGRVLNNCFPYFPNLETNLDRRNFPSKPLFVRRFFRRIPIFRTKLLLNRYCRSLDLNGVNRRDPIRQSLMCRTGYLCVKRRTDCLNLKRLIGLLYLMRWIGLLNLICRTGRRYLGRRIGRLNLKRLIGRLIGCL